MGHAGYEPAGSAASGGLEGLRRDVGSRTRTIKRSLALHLTVTAHTFVCDR
jgi:hypothetical protein